MIVKVVFTDNINNHMKGTERAIPKTEARAWNTSKFLHRMPSFDGPNVTNHKFIRLWLEGTPFTTSCFWS